MDDGDAVRIGTRGDTRRRGRSWGAHILRRSHEPSPGRVERTEVAITGGRVLGGGSIAAGIIAGFAGQIATSNATDFNWVAGVKHVYPSDMELQRLRLEALEPFPFQRGAFDSLPGVSRVVVGAATVGVLAGAGYLLKEHFENQ